MRTAIALAITLGCTPANAYTVRGFGASPCSEWNNGRDWMSKVQWAEGFVSGIEAVLQPKITAGTGENVSNDDVVKLVTVYCKNRPGDDIAEAASAVANKLNGR